MNNLTKLLMKVMISSACQFILFKIVLIMYLIYLPWPPRWWSILMAEAVIPLICGYIGCWAIHRKHFHIRSKGAVSRLSNYKIVCRLLTVLCFIVIGYALEVFRFSDPEQSVNVLLKIGIYNNVTYGVLFNFFSCFIAAIFPVVYAIVEFLFVSPEQKGA